MRKEYDFSRGKRNPYVAMLKKQFTLANSLNLALDATTAPDTPEFSSTEKEYIDTRLDSLNANPKSGSSWVDVKARLLAKAQ